MSISDATPTATDPFMRSAQECMIAAAQALESQDYMAALRLATQAQGMVSLIPDSGQADASFKFRSEIKSFISSIQELWRYNIADSIDQVFQSSKVVRPRERELPGHRDWSPDGSVV